MNNTKNMFLNLLILIAGFAFIFTILIFLVIWLFDIIVLYEDMVLFGIRGVSIMLEFIILLYMAITIIPLVLFFLKLNHVFTSSFMTRITSISVKINYEEIVDPEDFWGGRFYSVDDRFLVVKYKKGKSDIIWSSVAIVAFVLTSIADSNANNDGAMSILSGLLIPISFCLLLYILYCIFYPLKKVVFDRMKGEVTLPGLLILPSATVPFEEVINGHTVYFNCLVISHEKVLYRHSYIPGNGNSLWWSFYVWYMDRNRPLPKGNAFDPYRERDYERRKAEGFPEPLYPALYDTPEWGGIQKWEKKYNPKR